MQNSFRFTLVSLSPPSQCKWCSNACTCQTSSQYVDIYIVISERREKIFEDLDGMMGLASNGSNFVNPRVPISKLVWFGLGVNCWNGHLLVRAEYSRYLRLAIKVSTDFMGQEWKLSLIPNVIFYILTSSQSSVDAIEQLNCKQLNCKITNRYC